MNYTDLVALIKDYLETDETTFNSRINTFIKLAEERIFRDAQLQYLQKSATGSLTVGQAYLQLPTDFLSPFAITIGAGSSLRHLLQKDVSFIRAGYPDVASTGVPRYYALFDHDTLLLAPTPDQAYQVELHYFYKPTSITESGANYIGDNYENALLFASVLEGYIFLKGDADMLQVYQLKYEDAIGKAKKIGENMNRRDAFRRPYKVQGDE